MEMSETLRQGCCELSLDWFAREYNELADDLTNNKFEKFADAPRTRWDPRMEEWLVFERFLKHAESFMQKSRKRRK